MIGLNGKFLLEHPFEEEIGNSLVIKEPIGVVGCITPWNYPLHQIVAKIAPALAAGCTVVLKPAELAPLSALMLADAAHEIKLPAGVFNVVAGSGRVVGEAIVGHADVDMVSFTGSLQAGRRVAALAGDGIKKVCLELGGKSAFLVLDDAPFDKAIPAGVNNCMQNSGQTCSAWTRMLVPRARQAEAIELAQAQAHEAHDGRSVRRQNAARTARLGQSAQNRAGLHRSGQEGRCEARGWWIASRGTRDGILRRANHLRRRDNSMAIAQEEIFGPVLSIIPYDSEREAIDVANDSIYGLSGGVWAGSAERALEVARRLRTGQVDINGGRFNPLAPFGGYKKSGIGRELGPLAIEEFFQIKAIQR